MTVLLPLVAAVFSMILVAHLLPRPHTALGKLSWYALLLGESWAVARLVSRVVDRSLPLAALLEMSLSFPESAPNRLGMAQRGSSASMLDHLAVSPPDETAQEAAERILRLLTALSTHDRFTRGHAERVRAYTDLIAEKMQLSEADRERLRWAALLHDIGKLQVPSELLNKAGKPTPVEWDVLRGHPLAGAVIAAPLLAWLSPMDRVIAEHHERFDGTGYPMGLRGGDISLGARIVTVADSFEAMTAARSYSTPMKRDAALREVVRCASKQFDPLVVRAFLAVPQRRLTWAMGPAAWLAGLPAVGQGSLNVARTAAAHAGTAAVGVTSVAVVALAPAALASPTAPSSAPVVAAAPTVITAAATTSVPPAKAAAVPAASPVAAVTATSPVAIPATTPVPAATTKRPAAKRYPAMKPPSRTTRPHATPTHSPLAAKTRTFAPAKLPVVTATPPAPARATQPTKPTKPKPRQPGPVVATTPPPAPVPMPPAAPAPAPAPAQCVASYVLTPGTQGDQFAAVTTVRNSGTPPMRTWSVTWTFGGQEQVQSFTGTVLTQNGQQVTATNVAGNGALPPGGTATFAVTGARHGAFELPRVSCTAT